MKRKRENNGYSTIEVLISIVVLSVGVLGSAGSLLAASRTTQQSSYQTAALQLAADIADTVRAYVVDDVRPEGLGRVQDLDYTSTPGALPVSAGACYFTACELAGFLDSEVEDWKIRMATSFPKARLRICRDAIPWNEAGQAYRWDCSSNPGGDAPLVIKLGWQAKNPDGSLVKGWESDFPPSVVLPVAAS